MVDENVVGAPVIAGVEMRQVDMVLTLGEVEYDVGVIERADLAECSSGELERVVARAP